MDDPWPHLELERSNACRGGGGNFGTAHCSLCVCNDVNVQWTIS